MKPEDQRVAIAEACGWTDIHKSGRLDAQRIGRRPGNLLIGKNGYEELPNYRGDLNACHEMEKSLTTDQLHCYYLFLKSEIAQPPEGEDETINSFSFHATATQRCEAFLRATSKWKPKTP